VAWLKRGPKKEEVGGHLFLNKKKKEGKKRMSSHPHQRKTSKNGLTRTWRRIGGEKKKKKKKCPLDRQRRAGQIVVGRGPGGKEYGQFISEGKGEEEKKGRGSTPFLRQAQKGAPPN